ncbi:MAG: dihydroxy-acid dehydratase [Candidatus Omnitrophota bacterium]
MRRKNSSKKMRILIGSNPYAKEVQGKANEPICVARLLERAGDYLKNPDGATLEEIYDRLEENAPRVAVITGSPDQPAHIMDEAAMLKAVASLWNRGAVPFAFGVPVMCDGTAQSTQGMCYSLASRNLVSAIVVNQMESHSYHGAFVLQGCDKTPFAIVNALASLDVTRRARGEAPVFGVFAPAHVLRGGVFPDDLRSDLLQIAARADENGAPDIGGDIRETLRYLLQCTTNQAFQGILKRAEQKGIISIKRHKELEKRLAVHTCHRLGGICAFNGTGNSSRHLVCALGLAHPALDFLTEPPTFGQVDEAVVDMLSVCNDSAFGVSNIVIQNIENAVRVHSAMGGSTNLTMHLVASMIYAGRRFTLADYDRIRRQFPIPDLFDFSLTLGRDIFALARQSEEGRIRGVDTMLYELRRNGVPIAENAPTMTGTTWKQRLKNKQRLAAANVKDNPIILSHPRRAVSGIDILQGNFFDSAIVKISGMPDVQLDEFDNKIAVVLYCENEEEATSRLLDVDLLNRFQAMAKLNRQTLLCIHRHNTSENDPSLEKIKGTQRLFRRLIEDSALRIALIIAGVGPEGYGMPEMFTPMHHINCNQSLKKMVTIISDGRYSGVSYGAAVGHVTPEAYRRGGILYLATGDLLLLSLRKWRIDLLDLEALRNGEIRPYREKLEVERKALGEKRWKRMNRRLETIDPSNQMRDIADASQGVVPLHVWKRAVNSSF